MDDIKSKAAETEALISSVLTSNPLRMTIRDLDRQFKELNGYRIPFSELGYCSLESYLHSIPHCLTVNGRGYDAELCLMISQKSAHIDSLIRKQRPPKRKPRLSIQNPRVNFSNHQPIFTYQSPQIQKSVPFVQRRRSEEFHLRKTPDNNIPNVSSTLQNNITSNVQHIPSLLNQSLRQPHKIFENVPSTSQNNQNPSMVGEKISNAVNPISLTSRGVIPKSYNNKNNSTVLKNNVPYYIQNRLKELISNHPEGLHSSKLIELYKKKFKHNLNYSDYGYKSITHFCLDFKTIFAFKHLKDGSFQIYDKELNLKLEHGPEKDEKDIEEKQFDDINWEKTHQNKDPPLPDGIEDVLLEFHMKQLLSDVVYDANIIRQWIETDVSLQDFIDIEVAEVYDPSKFWIHLRQHSDNLNRLMDNMQIFYRANKDKYYIPYYAIREGMYLASIFDGEYHRAKVVDCSKKMDGDIKVFYVDYGTIAVVRVKTVCYLTVDFVNFPAQAIRARLYGIQPTVKDELWPQQASSRFLQLVRHKSLVAQIYDIDENDMILDLIVVDTSTPGRDLFINDLLIQEQLATFFNEEPNEKSSNDCTPTVPNVYLYPTHEEFETGTTLTYTAMLHLQACNFSYDRIFPKYFKKIENVESKTEDSNSSDDEIINGNNLEIVEKDSESIKNDSENNTEIIENELIAPSIGSVPEHFISTLENRNSLRPPPGFRNLPQNSFGVDPNLTYLMFLSTMHACKMMKHQPFYHNYIPPHLNQPPTMMPPLNYYNPPYPIDHMNSQQPQHFNFYPPNYQQYHNVVNYNCSPNPPSVINRPKENINIRKCEYQNDEIKITPEIGGERDRSENPEIRYDKIDNLVEKEPEKNVNLNMIPEIGGERDRSENPEIRYDKIDNLVEKEPEKNVNLNMIPEIGGERDRSENPQSPEKNLNLNKNKKSKEAVNSFNSSELKVKDSNESKTPKEVEENKTSKNLDLEASNNVVVQTIKVEENEKNLIENSCVEQITNSFKSMESNLKDLNQQNVNKRNLNDEDDNEKNLTEMIPEKISTESNFDDLNQNTITKSSNNEIDEKMIESPIKSLNILNATNDEYQSALENEIKITFHDFGSASLHIVTDSDDKYLILQEFRKELLNSFPLEIVRRAIATAPVLINIDNILLDEIPSDLKADMLTNNIITSSCNKIDIFPVNQIREVFRAIYGNVSIKPEHDIFLKEIDCYFTNNNDGSD
ncbi:uncharacterized protein [Onthophagus taurus]|uniref:uncharacterized protein n=1 Tax=Onthophagus taurus TaxID=166361 RepID=UPI0039BDC48E